MEPLLHYIISVLALLAIFPKLCERFGYKKILLLGVLSILPDFDVLAGMHRYLFHNLFFTILIIMILWLSLGKIPGLLSVYFLGSHLLFDMNIVGISLLWPIYKNFLGFEVGLFSHKLNGLNLIFNFFSKPFEIKESFMVSWYLSPMGTLVLILVIVLLTFKFYQIKNRIIR